MPSTVEIIREQLAAQAQVLRRMETELAEGIASAAEILVNAFSAGKKLLVMGNGGSAADAQHFAAEIVGRFRLERRALPAIALTTDSSAMTSIANDYGFDRVFSRQVEALANVADVVVVISTSGNSANIVNALQAARSSGCHTIALLGKDGGAVRELVQLPLIIPSDEIARIQEGHMTTIHILCDLLEKGLLSKGYLG